jgi:hypothetical protein
VSAAHERTPAHPNLSRRTISVESKPACRKAVRHSKENSAMPIQRTPLLPLVGNLGEEIPRWTVTTVEEIYDTYFSGDDGVEDSIRGINGESLECLITSFEDPKGTRETQLFKFLFGWGREPFPNSSRGLLWYSPQRKGIVVAFTDHHHETHLYLLDHFKDFMAFDICLAQVREICVSISEESDGLPMMR